MEMADGDRFTPEQAEALRALRDGRNVFLSGNAGTGKSYVLNAFISDLKARNVDFLALAPTGIAALNLTDGSTIHRTLKIAPGVCAPDGPKGSRKVLDAAKVIIIDEISMCRIADSINRENVDALDAPKVEFAAAATGTVSNGDKMAPERIVLCRGARVMSLVNSPQEGYVNGTQGTVTDASADAVTVKFDGVDEKVRIERHRWEINKSEAVVEMDDEGRPVNRVKTAVVGAYTQIPLKLAYAITIHKSQGLTFDACCVHTKVFAEGQLYVGLSRVRSAAGLTVFPKIEPNRLIASREVVEFYDSLEHRMEEPVQIECPRRYESRVRAYIRDLMDGRDPDAPTPPALEGALENSKGGTPEPGTERPARTLEEKIGRI